MQKRLPALFLVFCFFVHRTHAKVAATVDIKHDPCTRTLTCITNGSSTLTWKANGVFASLWRSDNTDKFKTINIGQGGSANMTLIAIEDIPNGMMQSTFAVLSPGSLKSLTVMCITDDGTNKTLSVQMEGCPSSVSSASGSVSVTTPSDPPLTNADSGRLSTAEIIIIIIIIIAVGLCCCCCGLLVWHCYCKKSKSENISHVGNGSTAEDGNQTAIPMPEAVPTQGSTTGSNQQSQVQEKSTARKRLKPLDAKPKHTELQSMKCEGKPITVIKTIQMEENKWRELAKELGFEESTIKEYETTTTMQVSSVFQTWISGAGKQPATWNALIEALKRIKMEDLAEKIKTVVTYRKH